MATLLTTIVPVQLPPKYTSETVPLTVDFSRLIPTGDSLLSGSVPTVTAENVGGVQDINPSAILSGVASISGTQVLQNVIGGIGGSAYKITILVTTTLGYTREGQVMFWVVP